MHDKSDSKWRSLATVPILGQAPRDLSEDAGQRKPCCIQNEKPYEIQSCILLMDIIRHFISLSEINAAMGIAKKRRNNIINSSVVQTQKVTIVQ